MFNRSRGVSCFLGAHKVRFTVPEPMLAQMAARLATLVEEVVGFPSLESLRLPSLWSRSHVFVQVETRSSGHDVVGCSIREG